MSVVVALVAVACTHAPTAGDPPPSVASRAVPAPAVTLLASATASQGPTDTPSAARPDGPAASAIADAPPPGFEVRTIRHETIHARLLVPRDGRVELGRDPYGYPRVTVDVDGEQVVLQFDSGVGALGATLARTPPTVYGLPTERASVSADGLAAQYRDAQGDLRILGAAPGVKCSYEPFREPPAATLARVFTVCASLRSPPAGPWRPATSAERANGGMTDVPEGAWVEQALPSTPGSLLRPGKFTAHLYLGRLVVRGAACPASVEALRAREAPEVDVEVEVRAAERVWIRRVTEAYDGVRYPGPTTVLAARGPRCCRVDFVPWTSQPAADDLAYAVRLCDTFRAE